MSAATRMARMRTNEPITSFWPIQSQKTTESTSHIAEEAQGKSYHENRILRNLRKGNPFQTWRKDKETDARESNHTKYSTQLVGLGRERYIITVDSGLETPFQVADSGSRERAGRRWVCQTHLWIRRGRDVVTPLVEDAFSTISSCNWIWERLGIWEVRLRMYIVRIVQCEKVREVRVNA